MGQEYSDPKRAGDPHSLPNVEVFEITPGWNEETDEYEPSEPGFYWWPCFPGCMPDGDAKGPFESYAEALADARDGCEDDECPDTPHNAGDGQ